MAWKQLVKDYLVFSRKERIGLLVLVFMIIAVIILPHFAGTRNNDRQAVSDTAWIASIKKLEAKALPGNEDRYPVASTPHHEYAQPYRQPANSSPAPTLFEFDPNTIDAAGWKKLGLKDRTIQVIQHYLDKGGHFYKVEDLKRVYGLGGEDYERIEPFARIGERETERERVREKGRQRNSITAIDINVADTAAFSSLPGIGAKLAARIVSFREKLGGFYSTEQVGETYGLADSVFQKLKQYLKLENASVNKIDINTATFDQLKAHPYIRYALAKAIIAYRTEHGSFSKIEDLKQVMAVTPDIYGKVMPYLTLGVSR